jgi:hypothetical protein
MNGYIRVTPEQREILSLRILPARLTPGQTADLLGFALHDIPILVAKGILRPLGKPLHNSSKWFAAMAVRRIAEDEKLLSRACEVIQAHWWRKNHGRSRESAAHS